MISILNTQNHVRQTTVDLLQLKPTEPATEYQQLLLNKYREQGLEL